MILGFAGGMHTFIETIMMSSCTFDMIRCLIYCSYAKRCHCPLGYIFIALTAKLAELIGMPTQQWSVGNNEKKNEMYQKDLLTSNPIGLDQFPSMWELYILLPRCYQCAYGYVVRNDIPRHVWKMTGKYWFCCTAPDAVANDLLTNSRRQSAYIQLN